MYEEDHPAAFENFRLRDDKSVEGLIAQRRAPVALFKPILSTIRTGRLLQRFPSAKAIFMFRHYGKVIPSSLKRFGINNRLAHVNGWVRNNFAEFASSLPPLTTQAMVRSLWSPSLTPESGCALYWLFYNQLYFDLQLDESPRVTLVRYETLIREPVKTFKRLCSFTGISYTPQMVEDIYTSSVQQTTPLDLDADIREACDLMWERLCAQEQLVR